jgi:hypothetical protein
LLAISLFEIVVMTRIQPQEAAMMWVIRGTNARTGDDFAMVVETGSRAAAEAWALKRGVPAAFIGQAEPDDIAEAKRTKQLWKYTPDSRYTCFGRPVFAKHLVCLMAVGVLTVGFVLVRTSKALPRLRFGTPTASRATTHRGAGVPAAKPVCANPEAARSLASAVCATPSIS